MTKLYHEAGSWIVPGKQGKAAERGDVPNSPDGLAAWLNSRRVPLAGDVFDGLVPLNDAAHDLLAEAREGAGDPPPASSAEHIEQRRMAMDRCPRCNSTPRGADLLLKGEEKDAVVDWIDQADELWQLEAVALAVKDRLAVLKVGLPEEGPLQ